MKNGKLPLPAHTLVPRLASSHFQYFYYYKKDSHFQ